MGKRPVETDVEIEAPVEKSSKRHEKSLLEVHQKKLHKKKKVQTKHLFSFIKLFLNFKSSILLIKNFFLNL